MTQIREVDHSKLYKQWTELACLSLREYCTSCEPISFKFCSQSLGKTLLFCFNFSTLHNPPTTADQGLTLPARPNYSSTKNVYLYYTVYLHPVLIAFITLSFDNLSILFN